jgi:hypothetical protein
MASFLDDLRAIDAKASTLDHRDLEVPRSGGLIVVRYRSTPGLRDKLSDVIASYRTGGALTASQEQQLLIDCHEQIMRRPSPGAEAEPYEPEPLRFDAGDDRWPPGVQTARDTVARLFKLDQVPLAAAGHVEVIVDWLQGLDADIAARTEGESGGGVTS